MLITILFIIPLIGVVIVSTLMLHNEKINLENETITSRIKDLHYNIFYNFIETDKIKIQPSFSFIKKILSSISDEDEKNNADELIKKLLHMKSEDYNAFTLLSKQEENRNIKTNGFLKTIAFNVSILTLIISVVIFILFDFSSNQFQFVQNQHEVNYFNIYLGVDGLSIYFILLTAIIIPISLLSNWTSISGNVRSFLVIILLLESLLLLVFLVLDILLFYIFFESILPPLFILIGLFGSSEKVRASFYLFLYTLLGSLFLLLSVLTMSSIIGTADFNVLFKTNYNYYTEWWLFVGIFIAFAVKTPVIFLNTWLLKAHVESPLSGSIILAGIVLKLSLYGIFRLILPLLPKAHHIWTLFVFVVGIITIIYASFSTLRTVDIKELIAYSSVSHAAVYLMGVFSNVIQGIEGGIILGIGHGFVSSGLFICAGGILYDRCSTRLITYYRGVAQLMPLFVVMFFILCLGNCGVPLTLNFVGEFLSLYGVFETLPVLGVLASLSIIFSAAYTIYMFNRIAFAGSYSKFFIVNIPDLNKREFFMLLTLVFITIILGVYPAVILDGLHYSVTTLIYNFDNVSITNFLLLFCHNNKSKIFKILRINIFNKGYLFNLVFRSGWFLYLSLFLYIYLFLSLSTALFGVLTMHGFCFTCNPVQVFNFY